MPSLPVQRQAHALMAIDIRDISYDNIDDGSEMEERERKGRVRIKSQQRVRSYQQLLEDFQEQSHTTSLRPRLSSKASRNQIRNAVGVDDKFEIDEHEDAKGEGGEEHGRVGPFYAHTHPIVSSPISPPRKEERRAEDTARRSKRFSLPAIGLHTMVVTARTSIEAEEVVPDATGEGGSEEGVVNNGLSKRFSLVLAGRNSHGQDDLGLAKGLAATRLSELLDRKVTTKN